MASTIENMTHEQLATISDKAFAKASKACDTWDGPDEIDGEWYEEYLLLTVHDEYVQSQGVDPDELRNYFS